MKSLTQYSQILQEILDSFDLPKGPVNLYESIDYIISLGGKRLRPLMVLMGADAYGKINDDTKTMALVVELFHNFSLMHDDIMDNADMRRGKPAVHIKWDVPTAILGGDALLVKTYQLLLNLQGPYRNDVFELYSKTAIEVCEGQQMDMNFETQTQVLIEEYIEMIRLKTAVLMAAAFKMGAISAGANAAQQDAFYHFGENLGIAFQIKDDYLDCFGSDSFGKRVGGDIIENKKTYLQIMSLALGSAAQNAQLKNLWKENDENLKIEAVKQLFEETGAKANAHDKMHQYYQKALAHLRNANLEKDSEKALIAFAEGIWMREH